MSKYAVVQGSFACHTCRKVVNTLRHYTEIKELTWMCPDKHLNKVSLETKKNKKDYEREERE